jgi:tetratricopeptide (TPR) repeat protein
LASLLKDLFSPEAERALRQRLIDSARHLLQVSGARRSARTRASDAPSARAQGRRRLLRKWLPLLVPVGAALLAGAVALSWPRAPTARGPGEPSGQPGAAPPSPTALPAAPRAAFPSEPSAAGPAPEVMAPVPPARAAKSPGAAGAEPVAAAARIDHLQRARAAFNARDWPRALAEGKSAVAAGDGALAHALLGSTYFKMGRFVEAERAYSRAAALDPANALLAERLRIARARVQELRGGKEN